MPTHWQTRVPAPVAAATGALAPFAAPLLLVGLALSLRLAGLDHPERAYFDEVYYVEDARALLDRGVEEGFVVHPPVGKWLIAAGIALVGDTPLGWRLPSALAGSLLVAVVYVAGLRLLGAGSAGPGARGAAGLAAPPGARGAAGLAALLVAVDGMAITMSRIAMLDIFLALFVAGAATLMLVDADHLLAPGRAPPPLASAARWAAGAVLGLAVATKWSGMLAIGAAGLVALATEAVCRRRAGQRAFARPGRLLAGVALPLVVLPAAVYLASYAGWFANFEQTRPGAEACEAQPCEVGAAERLAAWRAEQAEIARFHSGLQADHPYRAGAETWPAMTRPVVYYFESCATEPEAADGDCEVAPNRAALILGIANPALWWLALLAYPVLAWAALRRRDGPAGWLLVFVLAQYLPWLAAGRPVFFFYTTPVIAFSALSLAWLGNRLPQRARTPAGLALGAAAVAAALFWYPAWVGAELSEEAWRARMLLRSWY